MEIEPFVADTWKQGNSILITIPSHIVKLYDIKEKETCQVYLRKKSMEEIKKERSLERLRIMFRNRHEIARIVQGKKVIAEIPTIFFQLRQGAFSYAPDEDLSETLKKVPYDRFHGEIFEGRLSSSNLEDFFDGKVAWNGRYLRDDCVLEIKEDQKTLKINKIEFEPPLSNNIDLFEVKIRGQLSKGADRQDE